MLATILNKIIVIIIIIIIIIIIEHDVGL